MGENAKLFIATKPENILKVMPKVIEALNVWQRKELDQYWDKKGFENRIQFLFRDKKLEINKDLKDFTNGIYDVKTFDFRSFDIYLTVHGENRSLFITHTCSNDYSDTYVGEKIIFSLGSWGLSKEIMMVVANSINQFGDIYFTNNDCSEEFEKLNF